MAKLLGSDAVIGSNDGTLPLRCSMNGSTCDSATDCGIVVSLGKKLGTSGSFRMELSQPACLASTVVIPAASGKYSSVCWTANRAPAYVPAPVFSKAEAAWTKAWTLGISRLRKVGFA